MNKVIEILIEFINALRDNTKEKPCIEYYDGDIRYALNSPKYILGQLIRQYSLSWDHYYISKEAKNLWESITDKPMGECWYRDTIKYERDNPIIIRKYKGNSNQFEEYELKKGSKFVFNDVFHDEHMITISDIVDELLRLNDVNEKSVIEVLDKMYICRMLKQEDRKLYPKVHRSLDINEVIENIYNGKVEIDKEYFLDKKHTGDK